MNFPVFTSESVCAGHPDKICDAISDAILDAAYTQDPQARVAVEALVSKNLVVLAGEVTFTGQIDYRQIVKQTIKRLGFTDPVFNFTPEADIIINIHQQSPDIARGVNAEGAGDQGIMYGYACTQTANYMPLPIELAHALTQRVDLVREQQLIPYLRPDGKAQVTVGYHNGQPKSIETVVLAVPHHESINQAELKQDLINQVILPVVNEYKIYYSNFKLIVNGTGVWHIPGPASDTGLTGRKIIVDTYGGYARIGGGAFSGKDVTKVDRSGAYAARFAAKNIVAHGYADECEVALAYVIGQRDPVMKAIDTFGTAHASDLEINRYVDRLLDFSVWGIINQLHLNQPIFSTTACYGHFGRAQFPWEKIIE